MRNLKHRHYEHRNRQFYMVSGPAGAIVFHYWDTEHDLAGLETHYAVQPDFLNTNSHHQECWWLDGAPCWHTGTSLWASEYWLPMFLACGEEWLWPRLEQHYKSVFEGIGE